MESIRKFLTCISVLLAFATSNCLAQGHCLIVSDMHFNPFYTNDGQHNIDTVLRNELANAPVAQWDSILTAYNGVNSFTGVTRGYDSDYNLIKSAIKAMSVAHPKPDFIVITGDFIWHSNYKQYLQVPFNSIEQQHLLKIKTMSFLAGLLRAKFPNVPVIPALGNNDSDNDDYVYPTDEFLTAFARDWNLNPSAGNKLKVDTTWFKMGGYYKARLGKQTFLVLNTTLLSKNSPDNNDKVDSTMFAWLDNELSVPGQKAWIISHIPPGSDMVPEYTAKLISVIKEHSKNVQFYLSAHTHFNDFRVICDTINKKAYAWVRMVASIGPNHDNSPGYIYAEYDKSGNLVNEQQHYLDLNDFKWKMNYGIGTVELPKINAAGMFEFMLKTKDPFNAPGYLHFHSLESENEDSYLQHTFMPNLLQVSSSD